MKSTETIFEENDRLVTQMVVRVLRFMILVFPALMLMAVLGIFSSKLSSLIPLTGVGLIVTWGPTLLYKLGVPDKIMKNLAVIAVGILVAMMASDASIGIYMTYGLAMVISIFYYDKGFTRRITVISAILLTISMYFRSKGVLLEDGETNFRWFIAHTLGYMMEMAVMGLGTQNSLPKI